MFYEATTCLVRNASAPVDDACWGHKEEKEGEEEEGGLLGTTKPDKSWFACTRVVSLSEVLHVCVCIYSHAQKFLNSQI